MNFLDFLVYHYWQWAVLYEKSQEIEREKLNRKEKEKSAKKNSENLKNNSKIGGSNDRIDINPLKRKKDPQLSQESEEESDDSSPTKTRKVSPNQKINSSAQAKTKKPSAIVPSIVSPMRLTRSTSALMNVGVSPQNPNSLPELQITSGYIFLSICFCLFF